MNREPEIIRAAREFKTALLAGEEAHQFEMARRYLAVETSLQDKIDALAARIALMREQGREPTLGALYRLDRWRALEAQMLTEISGFNGWAAQRIAGRQAELAALGGEAARTLVRHSGGLSLAFDTLPSDAIAAMVGFAGDGSPLSDLLAEIYPLTSDAVANSLISGVALGKSPSVVAREMGKSLAVGLDRAFLIARTEEHRSFRAASQDKYLRYGIELYRRMATLDSATCIGCLAADGQLFSTRLPFDAHPACRCTLVPVVPGASQLPDSPAKEWFEAQSRETQAAIMGPGRLVLYESGAVGWNQMWTRRDDETWGGAIVPTPLYELSAGEMPAANAA